ncbi:DUF3631 domain-containing protein [Tabrizicola sp. BL-A-41-H6]|uniref:DUF3631 domain-containing protein n=1 Tax=Tabrizicola sp. BL-A-41-H6 TaxID=3421107 RepID=UPI003D66781E
MDGNEWVDSAKAKDVTAADAMAEVKWLSALDRADYEIARKGAGARLGWRVSVLDAEVQKVRPRDAREQQVDDADSIGIETLTPWLDPVDGASLAEEIRNRLRAHVVFGASGDADAATLWIFGSYLMETWRLWPRLMVTSPTKACGKSTLLEVLDAMVQRGFIASNASPAAVFRAIEAWQPTLLLDEADTWMTQNEELAGVLNSGHTRRTARVIRVAEVNGEHLPVAFSTWCAMAIAGIGAQRDTLMSRSIVIGLRRRLPDEPVDRLPFDLHQQLLRIRRQLARWAVDTADRIAAMQSEPPDCGDDRRRDNWTPLHRIAAALGCAWPDRVASAYAAQAQAQDEDTEPAGVMMLRDLAEMFASRRVDRIASSELVGDLLLLEERPWAEWRHGRPVTAQSVAKLLKPFGVKVRVLKLNGAAARVYLRTEIEAAAARYTPQTRNPVTLAQNQEVTSISKRNLEPGVTPVNLGKSLKYIEGYGVTPATTTEATPDILEPDS